MESGEKGCEPDCIPVKIRPVGDRNEAFGGHNRFVDNGSRSRLTCKNLSRIARIPPIPLRPTRIDRAVRRQRCRSNSTPHPSSASAPQPAGWKPWIDSSVRFRPTADWPSSSSCTSTRHTRAILAELLQRRTTLSVEQVGESVRVVPNHVYLIPPNADLSLRQGVLHRVEPPPMHGSRLPIDVFFRSLALERREHSIGLILSGMGRDGARGLRAIKEAGGLTLVQDPAEARFEDMPRSAIAAGLADIVAPAGDLYGRLLPHLHRARSPRPPQPAPPPSATPDDLDTVIALLRNHIGHDFSLYKKSTLQRRIERRRRLHQLDEIAHYVRYLQDSPLEREQLFQELLIGVTSFFRDPAAWVHLRDVVIPELLERRPAGTQVRAWIAGCSTGEEAYSLGIVFHEALERLPSPPAHSLQIFATDLDPKAIARARQGVYPLNISSLVSPERLQRFFTLEDGNGYRIGKDIRELVIFAEQNVVQDPPFTRIDLLICRNLLIYMTTELQRRLLSLFHYSLNPGGVLFLGSAETVSGSGELFPLWTASGVSSAARPRASDKPRCISTSLHSRHCLRTRQRRTRARGPST
ncbi:MAG: hypothetical protein MZV65_11260 [Chromatiales bacterium]|nr:hypothetical protein [Chromatiales bacterium]